MMRRGAVGFSEGRMVPTRDRTIALLAQQGKEKGQPREVVTELSSVDGTGVRVGYSQHRMCTALQ